MGHKLIIVCGPPAAGKSTHARTLATETGAALLELDTVSEPIVQAALSALGRDPDDRDSPFYKSTFREPIYTALFKIAAENLEHGPVILVGPFTSELRETDWIDELSARFATEVEVHFVTCPEETRRRRMAVRANPRDRSKLEDWTKHAGYYSGSQRPACPHLLIDNDDRLTSGP